MNNQQGIGLPEILIALLLASITLMALIRHYLNIKQQSRRLQISLAQSIELQLVTDLIRDSSKRAGFTPCMAVDHLTTIDQRNHQNRLVAIEIDKDKASAVKLNRMNEEFDTIKQVIGETELLITKNKILHRDQVIMIADCFQAEVQKIKQIRQTSLGQQITLTEPLAFKYYPPVYLGPWVEETYSIHTDTSQHKALFYQAPHADELTKVVHGLSVHIEKNKGRSLLQVILGLEKGKPLTLSTMVRNH